MLSCPRTSFLQDNKRVGIPSVFSKLNVYIELNCKMISKKVKLRFNQSKSFFFNVFLPLIDEGSDVFSAINHFMQGNYANGGLTVYFTINPAVYAAISQRSSKEFFNFLPFYHLKTHLSMHKEIAALQEEVSNRADYPNTKSFYKKLLQAKETELQDFKVFICMGESAPQFILALTILLKKGSLEEWIFELKDPIALLQVTTSLGSTVLGVTGLITDLPVNGETPIRKFVYKFLKMLPLMNLVAVPRLFSLSTVFSLASIYNWMNLLFFSLLTLGMLLAYGISYFGLCSYLKRRDKSLMGVTIKGFFTSIIAPCLIGTFYSPFLLSTSVLSAVFHSLMLGATWITSIHYPQILMTIAPNTTSSNEIDLPEDLEENLSMFRLYCMVLIPLLMGSIFFSYLMHKLYMSNNQTAKIKAHISTGNVKALTKAVENSEINLNGVMANDMFTPVAYAAEISGPTGEEPGAILQLLIAKHQEWNINFNAKNRDGQTALMRTAIYKWHRPICVTMGNLELLLQKSEQLKLDVNAVDDIGETALMHACQSNDPQVIPPFLECVRSKGINVNAKDEFGRTAFICACQHVMDYGEDSRIDILMDKAKDLNMDLPEWADELADLDPDSDSE